MRRRSGVAVVALAVALAGCGGSSETPPSTPAVTAATSPSSGSASGSASSTSTESGALDLVWKRTGGIAGFNDRVEIDRSGRIGVTLRDIRRTCQLDTNAAEQLFAQVPRELTPMPPVTSSGVSDQMWTTLAINGGPEHDADDPALAGLRTQLDPVIQAVTAPGTPGTATGLTCS